MCQDMIVSILPGGQQGSAWRQPHQKVALAMRLLIFAAGGLTAYAVSYCRNMHEICNMQSPVLYASWPVPGFAAASVYSLMSDSTLDMLIHSFCSQ